MNLVAAASFFFGGGSRLTQEPISILFLFFLFHSLQQIKFISGGLREN